LPCHWTIAVANTNSFRTDTSYKKRTSCLMKLYYRCSSLSNRWTPSTSFLKHLSYTTAMSFFTASRTEDLAKAVECNNLPIYWLYSSTRQRVFEGVSFSNVSWHFLRIHLWRPTSYSHDSLTTTLLGCKLQSMESTQNKPATPSASHGNFPEQMALQIPKTFPTIGKNEPQPGEIIHCESIAPKICRSKFFRSTAGPQRGQLWQDVKVSEHRNTESLYSKNLKKQARDSGPFLFVLCDTLPVIAVLLGSFLSLALEFLQVVLILCYSPHLWIVKYCNR
jgi:hypothetical protein